MESTRAKLHRHQRSTDRVYRTNEIEKENNMGAKCGDNRFDVIAKAKAAILDGTNINSSPEEMAVLDNILFRCWQMGWLVDYDDDNAKAEKVRRWLTNALHEGHEAAWNTIADFNRRKHDTQD